jgi:hypothetical protein
VEILQSELPLGPPPGDPLGLSNRPAEITCYGPTEFALAMDWLDRHGGRCAILHHERAKGNAVWRLTLEWKG